MAFLKEPYIIAEMSANHNQSLERALNIAQAAIDCGVDALKLQTARPDHITLDCSAPDFIINDPKSLWNGQRLFDLYNKTYTPWEWHKPIFDFCRSKGVDCFSSPFDLEAVDFLESLNVSTYKIASFENIDLNLIRKVARTGKRIIISTGMATDIEIHEAVSVVRENGNNQIVLLKCTSTYPATPENTNILTIPYLKETFQCEVGLSDHTLGIGVAVASVALGASVIEKHFTLKRSDGGVDSAFSMEPEEMKSLVIETKRAWQSLGKVMHGPTDSEKSSLVFRRSLYIIKDMAAGEILTSENVRSIRPGYGLAPKYLDIVIGKKVNQNISRGTALKWEMIG